MPASIKNFAAKFTARRCAKVLAAPGVVAVAVALTGQYRGSALWWDPANGDPMQQVTTYADRSGELMVYNAEGPIPTVRNAFFQNMGPNGRACVTCHQPSNAMSLSTDRIHERWNETSGDDPVFAPVDGSNCPSLPQEKKSSHSLLLSRGVFRIPLPWPAENVKPDFKIEVVSDPTGCNKDPVYGLTSARPTISVFRRPRMVANLKYVLASEDAFDVGKPAMGSLTADGRTRLLRSRPRMRCMHMNR